MAQRILRERQMSKQPQAAGPMGVQYQAAQPPMPSLRGGGIIAFAQGKTVYGGPSSEANEGEAEALTGVAQSLEDQAKALRNLVGCENIVITLGANGAFVSDGKRSEIIQAPQVKAIDTVGAGDTLCANLAARLASGDDLFSSTRFGIYAASLKVTRKGSSMAAPSPEEVAKFIKEKSS
jgi:bifunctional ADP-heptose synthase (sugar kinase/adenylyltransferase)